MQGIRRHSKRLRGPLRTWGDCARVSGKNTTFAATLLEVLRAMEGCGPRVLGRLASEGAQPGGDWSSGSPIPPRCAQAMWLPPSRLPSRRRRASTKQGRAWCSGLVAHSGPRAPPRTDLPPHPRGSRPGQVGFQTPPRRPRPGRGRASKGPSRSGEPSRRDRESTDLSLSIYIFLLFVFDFLRGEGAGCPTAAQNKQ